MLETDGEGWVGIIRKGGQQQDCCHVVFDDVGMVKRTDLVGANGYISKSAGAGDVRNTAFSAGR